MTDQYDAVIVGGGPNGLAAAIQLAEAGRSVLLIEGKDTIGGGTRTLELTLPGYQHDICSAIHPLGLASPFIRSLPLAQYGLEWIQPDYPVGHAYHPDHALIVERSVQETAKRLGSGGRDYRNVFSPLVKRWEGLMEDFLGPLPLPPKHPFLMAFFGVQALMPATLYARLTMRDARAQALFSGYAGHSIRPLEEIATTAFGLMLGVLAHGVGWPMAKSGSHAITKAMGDHLTALGGVIQTGSMVTSLDDLPEARAVLFDLTPKQILTIAGDALSHRYRRQLERYRYGMGVFKVDWALSEVIPWADPELRRAGTVHIGGPIETVARSERLASQGQLSDQPFVLLAQQSQFDPSRAPTGKHTAWAYCHVPHGWQGDATGLIEAQVERYAPGFRDTILARSTHSTTQMEAYNPNYIGGDINGGVQDMRQLFTRPAVQWNPYRIPAKTQKMGLYICSSSTPPGGGVHGMCGYYAAKTVLRDFS